MMLSRRPWSSSQPRCSGSRVPRRTSSVSPSPCTASAAQPGVTIESGSFRTGVPRPSRQTSTPSPSPSEEPMKATRARSACRISRACCSTRARTSSTPGACDMTWLKRYSRSRARCRSRSRAYALYPSSRITVTTAMGTAAQGSRCHAAQAVTPKAATGSAWTPASPARRASTAGRTAPSTSPMTTPTPTAVKAAAAAAARTPEPHCSSAAPAATCRLRTPNTAAATPASAAARVALKISLCGCWYWRRSTPSPSRAPATRQSTRASGPIDISARNIGISLT